MKVSVIIVNWNGLATLKACLEALSQQAHKAHEVIVVDNGSQDGSLQFLNGLNMPELKLVALQSNHGFAGGNNAALPHVTGEIIGLLNNDAVPQPEWLKAGIQPFLRDEVGMVACKIVRLQDPETIDKVGHLIFRDGLNRGRGTGHPAQRYSREQQALWPDGCAGFYRKSLIDQIGFFDEDFFLYGEDADLGCRARWAGAECCYVPKSLVYHHHSASLGKFSPKKAYYIERNRLWVLIKNFPLDWVFISPFFTFARFFMNGMSLLNGKGSAAGFQKEHGKAALLKALLRAMLDGAVGVPLMWRKRKGIKRVISSREMKALMRKYQISVSELTLAD